MNAGDFVYMYGTFEWSAFVKPRLRRFGAALLLLSSFFGRFARVRPLSAGKRRKLLQSTLSAIDF